MNLQEIKNQIYAISDYKPGNPAYEREVENLINSAYMNLWNSKPWTFSTKKKFLEVHADITPERIASENGETATPKLIPVATTWSPLALTAKNTSLACVITQPVPRLALHPYAWKGNPIEIDNVEYTITHVEVIGTATSPKTMTLDGNTVNVYVMIYVDVPIRMEASHSTSWKIKQRFVYLPQDTSDVISVSYRPWPIIGASQAWNVLKPIDLHVDVRSAAAAWGNQETSGHATSYAREPDIYIPSGGKITYSTVTEGNTYGSFAAGDTLEVAWAYVGPGNTVGPLGEATKISIASGVQKTDCYFIVNTLHIDGSETESQSYFKPESAFRADQELKFSKQVFYNANFDMTTGKRLGPPRWLPIPYGATQREDVYGDGGSASIYQRWLGYKNHAESEDILGNPTSTSIEIRTKWLLQEQASSGERFFFTPKTERIRLYPRPDSWDIEIPPVGNPQNPYVMTTSMTYPNDFIQRLQLTYRYTPAPLSYQTDAPEMPQEFSQLIVYSALRDIYLKNNNMALSNMYDNKYERLFKDLAKRHVTYSDNVTVKGSRILNQAGAYGNHYRVTKL